MKPPAVNGKIIETAPKVPPSNNPITQPIIALPWSITANELPNSSENTYEQIKYIYIELDN